ncbi:hypothetical protein MMB232_03199 [Brevundimonas subvibrioides]|uniref:hypothetical protein n=1 Tax=Brevundimonas subvibrioides TaxID=74313 RepID=UPI0032D58052
MQGRQLEARSDRKGDLVERCQKAIVDGSYAVLSRSGDQGVILRLDLGSSAYVAAIHLDRETPAASVLMIRQAGEKDIEVAGQMQRFAFGSTET